MFLSHQYSQPWGKLNFTQNVWMQSEEILMPFNQRHTQHDSFNPTSNNPDILIIWLEESSSKSNSFAFHWRKKNSSIIETGRSQGHVQKGLKECLYIQLQWYILTICLLLHHLIELWRLQKTQKTNQWPWTSLWRRYLNGALLWLVVQTKCRSSNTKSPARM